MKTKRHRKNTKDCCEQKPRERPETYSTSESSEETNTLISGASKTVGKKYIPVVLSHPLSGPLLQQP